MKKIALLLLSISFFMQGQNAKFNTDELTLIKSGSSQEPMRVLQTTNPDDLDFLTQKTENIKLSDKNIKVLADRILATVLDPKSRGVGIAAPQVGIARKAFWVKRMDKVDQPFEFFVNPKITWYSDIKRYGKEGCLSIPDQSGLVYRSLVIQIEYFDLDGNFHNEIVEGFTAVIFQHEYDHLEGILYPDQIEKSESIEYVKSESQNELYYPI